MMYKTLLLLLLLSLLSMPASIAAQYIDLTEAAIITSLKIESPMRETVVTVLQEEIKKRTDLDWETVSSWKDQKTVIAIVLAGDKKLTKKAVPQRSGAHLPEQKPEGYRIVTETGNGATIIWIVGADKRGVLFGAGHLLRSRRLPESDPCGGFSGRAAYVDENE